MIFPLRKCAGVPINFHPGAFGFKRRVNYHPGVDLYTERDEEVFAIEDGTVVGLEIFTGPLVQTPFWNTTFYLMVEGKSGVFNYGEISHPTLLIGDKITEGEHIGYVDQVLFDHRLRPDIPEHSCSMLHLELYKHGTTQPVEWATFKKPPQLLDPTPYLLQSYLDDKVQFVNIFDDLNKFQWDNSHLESVG